MKQDLIDGVQIIKLSKFHDDRGFIGEVMRSGEPFEIKQTTYTETFPGVIKAFHWHQKQWDGWFILKGNAKIILFDLRKESKTHENCDIIYAGENNPVLVIIPPGVAHGYRVLGNEKVGLLYHTSERYNKANPDEERIEWDELLGREIWETKNK